MSDLFMSGESALLVLIKIGIILFLLIYIVFAGVVVKQVRMMTDTLEVGFETQIKLIALLHFIFALVVLTISIFVL